MKGFKKLNLKEVKNRHSTNPQDKELQEVIENSQLDKQKFNKLIEQSTKQKPFDKK